MLENYLRSRVAAMPNVTYRQRTELTGLRATADKRRVTGVALRDVASGEESVLDADLVHDFFDGFAQGARANVHVKVLYGRSGHHQIEALFKAFGRALRVACSRDRRLARVLPSTKELL